MIDTASIVTQVKDKLQKIPKEKKDSILVVFFFEKNMEQLYNTMKTELDLRIQIPSQFITTKTMESGKPGFILLVSLFWLYRTVQNIVLAINAKVFNEAIIFARNAQVDARLEFMDALTGIIGGKWTPNNTYALGIDVHHPPPGSSHPSEAALSGSLDSTATTYFNTFRTQVCIFVNLSNFIRKREWNLFQKLKKW